MYRNITICIEYKYFNIYWLKLYMYMYYESVPRFGFNTWIMEGGRNYAINKMCTIRKWVYT